MLQKPNLKSFGSTAVQAIALGLGAGAGNGISTLLPDSFSDFKHWIVAAIGIGLAASISPKTTGGTMVQSFVLGVAGNGLYNGLTEVISPSVPVQDASTLTGRFVNALVGHKEVEVAALGNTMVWERTEEVTDENYFGRQEEKREIKIALV